MTKWSSGSALLLSSTLPWRCCICDGDMAPWPYVVNLDPFDDGGEVDRRDDELDEDGEGEP